MPHSIYGWPVAIFWLAWLVYWIVSARSAKAVRKRESVPSRLLHIVPMIVGAVLLGAHNLSPHWLNERFLPRSWAGYWIGLAFLAGGLAFSVWARRHLGGNWSGSVTVKEGHELIRSGPYRFTRHPIYSGILLAFLGTVIIIGQWRGLIAFVLILISLLFKLRTEERFMEEMFGDEYVHYRRDVPALIPRFVARAN